MTKEEAERRVREAMGDRACNVWSVDQPGGPVVEVSFGEPRRACTIRFFDTDTESLHAELIAQLVTHYDHQASKVQK